MKRLILFVAIAGALIGAAIVAPVLLADPGRVVVGIGPWLIETSFLALVLAVVLGWAVLGMLWAIIRWPAKLLAHRREVRSRHQLEEGFLALIEGEWQRAEQSFSQSLSHQKSVAGLLGAAKAAQARSDYEARDAWLARATTRFGRKHFVTEFARAQLAMEAGRLDEAIALFERLHLKKQKHLGVLRALLQAYQDSGRWRSLRELTPALKRAGMIDGDKAQALVQLAAQKELSRCEDHGQLLDAWKSLSRKHRQEPAMVLAFSQRAHALGHHEKASQLLKKQLDLGLSAEVLRAYRLSDDASRPSRILELEKRLKSHPDHPLLLETLGFLYLDDRQYEKAERCLLQVVQKTPSAELHTALGRLMDRQGNVEASARYYRNALQFHDGHPLKPLSPPLAGD